MCKRLDEDPSFALSVSQIAIAGLSESDLEAEDELDTAGDDFDDDAAVTLDQLAQSLDITELPSGASDGEDHTVQFDEAQNVYLTGGIDDEVAEPEEYEDMASPEISMSDEPPAADRVVIFAVEECLQDLWHLSKDGNYVFRIDGDEAVELDGIEQTRYGHFNQSSHSMILICCVQSRIDCICMFLRLEFNLQELQGEAKATVLKDLMNTLNWDNKLLSWHHFEEEEPYYGLPNGYFTEIEVWDCLRSLNELGIVRIEIR